jgi:hypothetical protein
LAAWHLKERSAHDKKEDAKPALAKQQDGYQPKPTIIAAAAAPGLSQQRGTRVFGEEEFDSLGSFLGCLLRISSAHLASLDSIRDRFIDLRWNARLTSSGREYHVLK